MTLGMFEAARENEVSYDPFARPSPLLTRDDRAWAAGRLDGPPPFDPFLDSASVVNASGHVFVFPEDTEVLERVGYVRAVSQFFSLRPEVRARIVEMFDEALASDVPLSLAAPAALDAILSSRDYTPAE